MIPLAHESLDSSAATGPIAGPIARLRLGLLPREGIGPDGVVSMLDEWIAAACLHVFSYRSSIATKAGMGSATGRRRLTSAIASASSIPTRIIRYKTTAVVDRETPL